MKYRISEFCRLLGVSPDTLRYYEKCGLLSISKDPENQYRLFSMHDAPDIWGLHMLRSLDMGITDIGKLRGQGTFEAQIKHLHQREAALKAEIEMLTVKRERLLQLSKLYDLVHAGSRMHIEDEMSAHYALYVLGEGCCPGDKTLAQIPFWIARLPFTYIAVEISRASLTGDGNGLSVRLGLGILENNLSMAGLTPGAEAIYPQRRKCMHGAAHP